MKRSPERLLVCLVLLVGAATACGIPPLVPGGETSAVTPLPGATTAAPSATPVIPATTPAEFDKWSLWTNGTQLRGANVYQRRVYPELDGSEFMGSGPLGPPYTQEDFDRLAALGANYVNVSHPGLFAETPPYILDGDVQANLDRLLAMIAQADMFAVISFRTGPGRAEFSVCCLEDAGDWYDESYLNDTVWQDQAAQDAWVAMWRTTAERYRDDAIIVGYDLMVEPNANEVWFDLWDPEEFHDEYGGTLYDWNQLYPRITAAIREVDAETPILVGGMGYSGVEWMPYLEPTGDPRTVYVAHQYAPHIYTHQDVPPEHAYPGEFDTDWDGEDDRFDRAWLEDLLSTVDEFAATHGVPVAVNEFGVVRWAPGAAEFMGDQMDLFERRGWSYALWAWEPAWEPWAEEVTAFNFRYGPDPVSRTEVENDLMGVIVKYWEHNTVRPSSFVASVSPAGPVALSDVSTWAYQIQGLSEPEAVDALVASRYDMLVLEPTRTDWSSGDRRFDTQGMVARLKASPASDGVHRKLVVAYVDIGEAEDWRWYWAWSRDWDCLGESPGDPPADWPDYILACDPDGWSGNYPVAYWDPLWKDVVIFGEHQDSAPYGDYVSVIDEVVKDGFDGVYLDWVEGYEDEAVVAAARAAGVDPAVEMIAFIREIRAYARARNPDFVVIQQNAAALSEGHPELFDLIDGIAQEEVWYGGDATDDWDDPDGYDWEQEAELSDYYLEHLRRYRAAGLPVFNCEYALAHADAAYEKSYREGFVPYVTRRSLSRLTTTPPPGY